MLIPEFGLIEDNVNAAPMMAAITESKSTMTGSRYWLPIIIIIIRIRIIIIITIKSYY